MLASICNAVSPESECEGATEFHGQGYVYREGLRSGAITIPLCLPHRETVGALGRGLTQPPGGQRSFMEETSEQTLEGQVSICKWKAEAGGFSCTGNSMYKAQRQKTAE